MGIATLVGQDILTKKDPLEILILDEIVNNIRSEELLHAIRKNPKFLDKREELKRLLFIDTFIGMLGEEKAGEVVSMIDSDQSLEEVARYAALSASDKINQGEKRRAVDKAFKALQKNVQRKYYEEARKRISTKIYTRRGFLARSAALIGAVGIFAGINFWNNYEDIKFARANHEEKAAQIDIRDTSDVDSSLYALIKEQGLDLDQCTPVLDFGSQGELSAIIDIPEIGRNTKKLYWRGIKERFSQLERFAAENGNSISGLFARKEAIEMKARYPKTFSFEYDELEDFIYDTANITDFVWYDQMDRFVSYIMNSGFIAIPNAYRWLENVAARVGPSRFSADAFFYLAHKYLSGNSPGAVNSFLQSSAAFSVDTSSYCRARMRLADFNYELYHNNGSKNGRGNIEGLIELYRQVTICEDPEMYEKAWMKLGDLYYSLGRYDISARYYEAVMKNHKDGSKVYDEADTKLSNAKFWKFFESVFDVLN